MQSHSSRYFWLRYDLVGYLTLNKQMASQRRSFTVALLRKLSAKRAFEGKHHPSLSAPACSHSYPLINPSSRKISCHDWLNFNGGLKKKKVGHFYITRWLKINKTGCNLIVQLQPSQILTFTPSFKDGYTQALFLVLPTSLAGYFFTNTLLVMLVWYLFIYFWLLAKEELELFHWDIDNVAFSLSALVLNTLFNWEPFN